jgi:predicted thioesterase
MPDIPIGTRGRSNVRVTTGNAISFLERDDARVLATPWLIGYLEMTARDSVKPWLLDEQDTVGTQVNVRHLAATPIGSEVNFSSEVTRVDGDRIEFKVEAWDEQERIAEGTHERFVIDIPRFCRGLEKKKSRPPMADGRAVRSQSEEER